MGQPEDMYLDTTTEQLYGPKTDTGWDNGVSLVGPRGPQGPQGVPGQQGPTGPTGPSASACQVTLGGTTYTSLQTAINAAQTNGTVVVTGICAGSVSFQPISSETLPIEGSPMVTLNGGGITGQPVLTVGASATVTLDNLVVTGGTDGGILNTGALTIEGATQVDHNTATATGTDAIAAPDGGGIWSGFTAAVTVEDMAQVDKNAALDSGSLGSGSRPRRSPR